jgi:prevent-host-death family protein
MVTVTLEEARAQLDDLIEKVAAGDRVRITRAGRTVAQIVAAPRDPEGPYEPIDLEELRRLTSSMTPQKESGGDFVRRMRDKDRY